MKFTKVNEDGHIQTFYFGDSIHDAWETQATTLESAIRKFRVGCAQPYKYVPENQQVTERITEGQFHEDVVIGAKPKARIPVFISGDRGRKQVASIPVEEPATVPLLTGEISTEVSQAMQIDLSGKNLVGNRQLVDAGMRELDRQKARLELQKAIMEEKLEKLRAQVALGMKSIWMVELYLGSKQELKVLREGQPADVKEPITVMQRVLCMDEELVVWAWFNRPEMLTNNKEAFDYKNLGDFDRWLLESESHLDQIIPAKKGIAALRVRREKKDRGECQSLAEAFAQIEEEACDKQTYILIRNGENLYRLWADTSLWPRMFPRRTEFDVEAWKKERDRDWISSLDKEEWAEAKEGYLRGLIVIQGLLDHTPVFHPLPERIVVFDTACVERTMRLIRDDEPALVADTSLMDWYGYEKWLQEQVRVGARVLWIKQPYYGSKGENPLYEATGIKSVCSWPDPSEIFTIDEAIETKWGRGNWKFKYNPGDTIYPKDRWSNEEPHERTRRVSFRAYSDEVISFDAISLRYLKHLLLDRSQRAHYMSALPMLYRWWNKAKAEFQHEEPFIKLVLAQAGIAHDDPARQNEVARCRRLVRWWKLRTKEARTLQKDEPKALRMILKAFQKGEDYEADPERGLPEPQFIRSQPEPVAEEFAE